MPNAFTEIWKWARKKISSSFKFKKKSASPANGKEKIKLARYLALGAIIVSIMFVVGVIAIIWSWKPWKSIDGKKLTVITTSTIPNSQPLVTNNPQQALTNEVGDLALIHCTPDSSARYLHWGQNTLEPGKRYYFNNEIRFRNRLAIGDTLHVKNERYESHVHWDMAYDTIIKGVVPMNKVDDGKGWGCYYMTVDKEVETYVYSPLK